MSVRDNVRIQYIMQQQKGENKEERSMYSTTVVALHSKYVAVQAGRTDRQMHPSPLCKQCLIQISLQNDNKLMNINKYAGKAGQA